jgi:ubiquitin-protein ligase
MSSVRLRRLQADFEKLSAYAQRHPRVRLVQVEGTPPEKYQVEFQLRSINQNGDQFSYVNRHLVEISLPRNYPRMPPQCRMLTPVFHPNIAPHAICIGDHWNAGEPLWSMVMRIGEMLAYQSYNTKSPLNGEAARWVEENMASLPLDPVPLYVDQADSPGKTAAAPGATGPVPAARVIRAGSAAASAAGPQPIATQLPPSVVPTARVVGKGAAPAGPVPASPPRPAIPARPVVAKPAIPATPAPATPPQAAIPAAPVVRPSPSSSAPAAARSSTEIPTARVVGRPPSGAVRPQVKGPQGTAAITCVCPGCRSAYEVPAAMAGKNARCKKCRTIITIPSQ